MSDLGIRSGKLGSVTGAEFLEQLKSPQGPKNGKALDGDGFAEALAKQQAPAEAAPTELKFSAHAKARLESRKIELSSEEMLKMQDAIALARNKGSKESLLLTDKGAFVVSVKNNTVITAVDKGSMKENVFTNIDSTIMI